MFVALLLAAGLLALEREQHAFGRLVRGLVSRTALLSEKVLLAALCSLVVCLLMLCGLAALTGLDWARAPAWLAALLAGGLGFAAMGTAIGALTREVQAASLLAFALSLPIAFLALVPVRGGRRDAVQGDRGRLGAVPVQAGAGGARRRDLRRRPRPGRWRTCSRSRSRFAALARLALRRFALGAP